MSKPCLIAVVGPTGSGKTTVGRQLAEKFDGIIISADSRQVYAGLDVGTNKEGRSGQWHNLPARYIDEIPQLLIDVARPGQRFTLANWLDLTKQALEIIYAQDKLPIIVGGTGLYVTALVENWQPPADNPKLRQKLEELSLEELDKLAGNLPVNDSDRLNRRRLVRIVERGGQSPIKIDPPYQALVLELTKSRDELYRRAETRYQDNWPLLLEEVRHLMKQGVSADWLHDLGLDYRVAMDFLNGTLTKDEAMVAYASTVHAYIRRQQTWWRHHGKVIRVENFADADAETTRFLTES
ncbi:MAG TPA: hypothetical protein VMQ44_00750 [Candidatus Saccharimonadales bacterium]|nr:hypothetical protein [Candidatus Saccharimonadales bacterium]